MWQCANYGNQLDDAFRVCNQCWNAKEAEPLSQERGAEGNRRFPRTAAWERRGKPDEPQVVRNLLFVVLAVICVLLLAGLERCWMETSHADWGGGKPFYQW